MMNQNESMLLGIQCILAGLTVVLWIATFFNLKNRLPAYSANSWGQPSRHRQFGLIVLLGLTVLLGYLIYLSFSSLAIKLYSPADHLFAYHLVNSVSLSDNAAREILNYAKYIGVFLFAYGCFRGMLHLILGILLINIELLIKLVSFTGNSLIKIIT